MSKGAELWREPQLLNIWALFWHYAAYVAVYEELALKKKKKKVRWSAHSVSDMVTPSKLQYVDSVAWSLYFTICLSDTKS